ncbi:hypothetical protein E1267_37715 [Nonomuraea longispora]|uniref:Lipoprotein n=1 Tax=Nonomuraea longispora TaxID=1848320 RepID=A0A4R4MXM3_9ACTN|nr:hypothetical protein [Nonomuraea longispora]TDB99382.1 hypothetical protein E1267_37715 [Nonomuraea longispora]
MRRTIMVIALGVLATGCGGGQSGPGVASVAVASADPAASASPTSTADRQEQARKFAQCMREHDVPMKDPDPGGGGGLSVIDVDKKKLRDATEACRVHAPFKDGERSDPEQVDRMRKFAACMRENGVDMSDPNPDGTMKFGAVKRDDPAFRKAFDVCGKEFPKLGGRK